MELDTKRNLIIGALDPRHNELDESRRLPGQRRRCRPRPGLPQRLLRHLLRRPGEPAPDRRLRLAARRPHGELHPGLQVHLDRRPGAALDDQGNLGPYSGRIGLPPFVNTPPQRCENRLIGDGRPIWVTDLRNPAKPEVSDQPIDLWRNDGYTDYSHDVDEDERGIAWVAGRGGIRGYATSGRHRDPYQNRVPPGHAVRPDPRRRRRRGVGRPERAGRRRHRAARDADAQLGPPDGRHGEARPASRTATCSSAPRRTSPTPNGCVDSGRIVLSDITDSIGGEPASQSTPRRPVPDEDAGLVPSVPQGHAARPSTRRSDAPRTTSRSRGRCSAPPGTARACACSTSRTRGRSTQVGYYRVDRHEHRPTRPRTRGTSPSAPRARRARRAAAATRLPVRHVPRRRGAADQEQRRHRGGPQDEGRSRRRDARGSRFAAKPVSSLVNTGDPNRFICPLFE